MQFINFYLDMFTTVQQWVMNLIHEFGRNKLVRLSLEPEPEPPEPDEVVFTWWELAQMADFMDFCSYVCDMSYYLS